MSIVSTYVDTLEEHFDGLLLCDEGLFQLLIRRHARLLERLCSGREILIFFAAQGGTSSMQNARMNRHTQQTPTNRDLGGRAASAHDEKERECSSRN
jgi:hypothetical protein